MPTPTENQKYSNHREGYLVIKLQNVSFYSTGRSKIQKLILKCTEENMREKGIAYPKFCKQCNSLLVIIIMHQKL